MNNYETKCYKNLIKRITELSESKEWKDVKKEWSVYEREYNQYGSNCICDHDINEEFYIKNKHNGNTTKVGSTCVTRFEEEEMTDQMKELKRVLCKPCEKILKDEKAYIKHKQSQYHHQRSTCSCCSKKFKSKLSNFKKSYYCQKCLKNDIKKCIDCNNPIGKISEVETWKTRCKQCYIKHKYGIESSEDDYFLSSISD